MADNPLSAFDKSSMDRASNAFVVPILPYFHCMKKCSPFTPLKDRILHWSFPEPNTGCWLWAGSTNDRYGVINVGGRNRYAHRMAYEQFVGHIEKGLTIDHLCRNPLCVNPRHLEVVTMRENILRSESPSAIASSRNHCPKGHDYTEENTLWYRGYRLCRACRRKNILSYRERLVQHITD